MAARKGLGRGLDALLDPYMEESTEKKPGVQEVDVRLIFVLIIIRYEHRAFKREEARVVEEGAFHTAAVGAVVVHNLPAALL